MTPSTEQLQKFLLNFVTVCSEQGFLPIYVQHSDWRSSLTIVHRARVDSHAVHVGQLRHACPFMVDSFPDLAILDGDPVWAIGQNFVSATDGAISPVLISKQSL